MMIKSPSHGRSIKAVTLQVLEANIPLIYSIVTIGETIYIGSSHHGNGGIFRIYCNSANTKPMVLLKNGSECCGNVHGIATYMQGIAFSDTGTKQIKYLDLSQAKESDGYVVDVIAGTGVAGNIDGLNASFQQPTALCVERNSIFVIDSASGRLCLITHTDALISFLTHLHLFATTCGLYVKDEGKTKTSLKTVIENINAVSQYFVRAVDDVKELSGKSNPQGPEGACSSQCISDLTMMIEGLQRVHDAIERCMPLFPFDIYAAGTLVVEHLFSVMRQGNETPLMLEFAHRFASSCRELMKQLCSCPFKYFTHKASYYQRGKIPVPYAQLPQMRAVTHHPIRIDDETKLKDWRAIYGQSVRQQSVRAMTTKDKAGTMPLYVYSKPLSVPRPVLFPTAEVLLAENNIDVQVPPTQHVIMKSHSLLCAKSECTDNMKLHLLMTDIMDSPGLQSSSHQCVPYVQDTFLPLEFIASDPVYIKYKDISYTLANDFWAEESDLIILNDDDILGNIMHIINDSGDSYQCCEADDDANEEPVDDVTLPVVTTRSGRQVKRKRDSQYLFDI